MTISIWERMRMLPKIFVVQPCIAVRSIQKMILCMNNVFFNTSSDLVEIFVMMALYSVLSIIAHNIIEI